MIWMNSYTAFFFDLDGLLVDTEPLHYAAFLKSAKDFGWSCSWDFQTYCLKAHVADRMVYKTAVVREFPPLLSVWEEFRKSRQKHYMAILQQTEISLLPGVEAFLKLSKEKNIPCYVVTNSTEKEASLIRSKLPFLETVIDKWLTRETYTQAKPHPDPYLTAKKEFNNTGMFAGFEDSPRGVAALQAAHITPVWIRTFSDPTLTLKRFHSFEDLLHKGL